MFAVGSDNVGAGVILHYDGHAWSGQTNNNAIYLASVWGSSATDVFAVGYEAAILHQNGNGWQAAPRPEVQIPALFGSVWGTSGTNVFAVGGTTSGSSSEGFIVHYDGTSWSPMTPSSGRPPILTDVAGTGSSDVYAVGYNIPHSDPPPGSISGIFGVIYHYDGLQWNGAGSWSPGLADLSLYGVWASSPSDVFVVGRGPSGGVVLHFNGTVWSQMAVPAINDLQDVWGTSASDVYAVGEGILHYDGRTWTKVSDQGGSDVWGSSATDVYVVGAGGTILHGTP